MDGGQHAGARSVLLCCCWLWCVQGLLVNVTPRRPLFAAGSRRHLLCAASGCPPAALPPHVSWTAPGDRPLGGTVTAAANGAAAVTFDPVTADHEGALQCTAVCGDRIGHAAVRVRVYAFPGPPLVSGLDRLRWGAEAVLTCTVPGVHPQDRLRTTWIRGDRVLHTGPQYRFRASREDWGAELTCRATLDLDHLGDLDQDQDQDHNRTRETTVTLEPLAPPTRPSLQLLPGSDVLEGDQVTFRCQSDGAPPPTLILRREGAELQRTGPTPSLSPSLLIFNVSSVTLDDSAHYTCEATNRLGSEVANVTVNVRVHPLRLDASPELWAELGSALVLTCRASGCPDPPELTWTRTHLDRDPDQDRVLKRSQDPDGKSLLMVQDLDLDQQGGFVCRAQCQGVIRERLVQVQVYAFPSDPVVSGPVPNPLLIGRESLLRCDVADVFSSNPVHLRWLWAGQVLLAKSFNFSGSPRNLSLDLRLRVDRDQIQDQDQDQNQDRVRKKNQVDLSCVAELLSDDGQVWRSRRRRINLEAQAPPTRPSLQLLPGPDVLEGDQVTFSCQSDGAPPPTLILRREGAELHRTGHAPSLSPSSLIFNVSSVALEDSAHYTCEATNRHGSKKEAVTLGVRAPPRNTSVVVLPSDVVPSGQNVTVCCRSVGRPPATVTLTRLSDGAERRSDDGNFLLLNVSDADSGLYRVNASNPLGYQVHVFRLHVTGPGPGLVLLAVPAVCSLIGLLATGLIADYLRRSRKKGFYQLAPTAPHSG